MTRATLRRAIRNMLWLGGMLFLFGTLILLSPILLMLYAPFMFFDALGES